MRHRFAAYAFASASLLLGAVAPASAAFDIVLNPDAGLAANSDALAAFNRAAAQWESVFTDNVTININAGLSNLGSSTIIGQTQSFYYSTSYSNFRNAAIADAANEPSNGIVASLPTSFVANTPGAMFSGNVAMTRANAKALGYTLDASIDAAITFNSNFSFYYGTGTPSNAQEDFETVALHEIGHALGFVSVVDSIGTGGLYSPNPLDMFRFGTSSTPTTAALFANSARELRRGQEANFSDTENAYRFSTGTTGDGNQASHWKADELTGVHIGIMDPSLAFGAKFSYTAADLRAFDLMGYDLVQAVPEPTTLAALGLGSVVILGRRRRSA